MALVEVVDLHRPTVDIARIAPTGVKTDCHAITSPGAPGLHTGRAGWLDADEFVGVRQDALVWLEDDDRVVGGDIGERLRVVLFAPLGMGDGLLWRAEVFVDL